ncbi:ATP-dependent endonuclease [uncultured Aggregatibacter sp.]|uniref:ATP-dependent nuclease n=1 Tax=uncultured Aggregatibacter sp. TaxID=470564 RepID=UPI001A561B0C|nr:ATP-binding protein [uncultured Aggregatibacter sp.]VTX76590.1 AAA domain protein [uncultured Aggregatibacter sp.]
MFLQSMEIQGYRGFQQKQEIKFAIPKQDSVTEVSGLTIITGSNNTGKSSIIECLKAREGYNPPSFPNGVRNSLIDKVQIEYLFDGGCKEILMSVHKNSSETKFEGTRCEKKIFVVPSRRAFEPYFSKSELDRESYILNTAFQAKRSSLLDYFAYRLFSIEKNEDIKINFNNMLEKVLGFIPEWAIDQSEIGQHFLKFTSGQNSHSSNGMGEGIVSIFVIVDALYDSKPGDIIAIDEPELSLHPSLQKRLSKLFVEYAKDRQIIISTHSPYFVDINALAKGAALVRVISSDNGTIIYQLSSSSTNLIVRLANNLHNPHTWGLDAREFFFQEDGIILVEGQEDVLLYPKIAKQLGKEIQGSFFGWGAGGAGNIRHLCSIAKDLGFKRVAAILDGDKKGCFEDLKTEFSEYHFEIIPADDIKTKPACKATPEKPGLLDKDKDKDKDLVLQSQYFEAMNSIVDNLNGYLQDEGTHC